MDGRPTWTDCDEAGDYAVPNVLSPRDLVFRPDNMDETVPHTQSRFGTVTKYSFYILVNRYLIETEAFCFDLFYFLFLNSVCLKVVE